MNLHHRAPRHVLRLSACAIALVTLAGCGDTGSSGATDTPTTSSTLSSPGGSTPEASGATEPTGLPTGSASAERPRLIDYAGSGSIGVEVRDRADADELEGAPEEFKQFVASTAEGLVEKADCDAASVGVSVKTLRTDGFALGVVNDCGAYIALWAVVDGAWKEIQGTQDFWRCQILERHRVPSDVAGADCYDAETKEIRDYSQA